MISRATSQKTILYFFIFIAGFLLISIWSAWLATHPKHIKSGLTPKNYNLRFEEIVLTTKDGILISGWFLGDEASQIKKPALIILHGYPAEKGDMLFIANSLKGYFRILLVDFRYFGNSGGSFTTLGTKELLDLEAAVDFFEERGFKKVFVLGFSLGGAVAIAQAAGDGRIAALASYASFADLTLLGKDAYSHLPVIREALIPLMKIWAKSFWGVDTDNSPRLAAKKLETPILLVHTMEDEQIPFYHAELLKEALKDNKYAEFYFPEKGRHGELPPDFEKRVKEFLLKHKS